jgi:hypothetical protein
MHLEREGEAPDNYQRHMAPERPRGQPTPEKPDPGLRSEQPDPELRAWLAKSGLGEAEVLAVIPNQVYDKLEPEQRRLLHGLLAAAFELRHQEGEDSDQSTPHDEAEE